MLVQHNCTFYLHILVCLVFTNTYFCLQNDEIRKLDEKIMEKECILNASTKKIAQVDEKILQIQQQLEKLQNERKENESNSEAMWQKKLE